MVLGDWVSCLGKKIIFLDILFFSFDVKKKNPLDYEWGNSQCSFGSWLLCATTPLLKHVLRKGKEKCENVLSLFFLL